MDVPIRHLLAMVGLAVALTCAAIGAVWLIGPSPRPAGPVAALTEAAPSTGTPAAFDPSAIYAARAQAVVRISTLLEDGSGVEGSGFLVDREGHILTNEHVIARASRITVSFGEERAPLRAELVGSDAGNDLALVKVRLPEGLRVEPLPLAPAGSARVGDPVLAIGAPFGLERSASSGIVSALGRQIVAPDGFPIPGVIQTDAAVNHGNSGGPLLDRGGRVIGINTQIADSGVDANVGIAFAVPVEIATRDIALWHSGESTGHAWVGLSGQTLPAALARQLGLPGGIQVLTVNPGGPAERAGLRGAGAKTTVDGLPYASGGDVIVGAEGTPLRRFGDLQRLLAATSPGEPIEFELVGADGARRTVTVTLGERPAP